MAKRVVVRTGDIFEVNLDNDLKGYFQFIMLDITQLNSEVIRVFKKHYGDDENPSVDEIVQGEVDFFAHVMVRLGVKMGLWKKIGSSKAIGDIEKPCFRDSQDHGNPEFAMSENGERKRSVSKNWIVWQVGEEFQYVGELKGEYTKYDIGLVLAPPKIVDRMNTGEYNFVYPKF